MGRRMPKSGCKADNPSGPADWPGKRKAEFLRSISLRHSATSDSGDLQKIEISALMDPFILISGVASQVLCSVWFGLQYRRQPDYVLVIDSGSSGTRMCISYCPTSLLFTMFSILHRVQHCNSTPYTKEFNIMPAVVLAADLRISGGTMGPSFPVSPLSAFTPPSIRVSTRSVPDQWSLRGLWVAKLGLL